MTMTGGNLVLIHPDILAVPRGGRVFPDTNIWVNAIHTTAPFHLQARAALAVLRGNGVELFTSRQVLREYAATMTRPQSFSAPLPGSIVTANVNRILAMTTVVEDGPSVFFELLNFLNTISFGGKKVHDANIAATLRAHNM